MKITQAKFTHPLAFISAFTIVIAGLMTALALAGLLHATDDLHHTYIPTDLVLLVIGLPVLLGVMALARRGALLGLLFWPGMLLFVLYHAVAFAAGAPFSGPFYLYILLAALSGYTIIRLLAGVDASAVQQQLQGKVFERIAGGALIGLGLLFAGLVVQIIINPASSPAEVATGIADLAIIPGLLIGGVLLWRRQAWGYVVGAGLLSLVSMLFVGLLAFFVVQPLVTGLPFPLEDFVAIAVMSVAGFVPFGLFVRGIRQAEAEGAS